MNREGLEAWEGCAVFRKTIVKIWIDVAAHEGKGLECELGQGLSALDHNVREDEVRNLPPDVQLRNILMAPGKC